ncbi:hypothetical protein [Methanococcoides methylutens]|uniref:Uncharacterized protein n=1 Tax=Methanococcoides methylutens MM1 TaxID=1434104 RepID=A0A0E3X1K4_METMT|nr:hypothetical protein [Methanococcoides methylutens]AKB85334.1 hypothetical protein MCMEM_1281 [Methanococcoides methylutens MM1]
MDRYRITSINRPLDPDYPTNRLILLICLIVLIISSLFHFASNKDVIAAAIYGLKAGISVFLVWAISREIDPDHEIAAFAPVLLSLIPAMIYGMQPLLALYWLLLILRIVNRSTGSKAGILDIMAALLIGAYLSHEIFWIFGIITAAALFIDSRLSAPEKVHLFAAIIMAGITLFMIPKGNENAIKEFSITRILALISMTFLFLLPLISSEKIKSKSDRTSEPLEKIRVKLAMVIFLLTAITFTLIDTDHNGSWAVLWCIATGIGLYRLFIRNISSDFH